MRTPPNSGARQASAPDGVAPDLRRQRGARSRGAVLRRAVDAASLDGLEGLSFGRLAADTGMSKAGVQTLFGTKEALQLATLAQAREMFIETVVRPAQASPPGLERLRHLVERWIVYAAEPLFEGGCLRVANLVEYDSKPGAVRDALLLDQLEWLALLREQIVAASSAGESSVDDVDQAVFMLDAVLCAANTSLRFGDETAVDRVWTALNIVVPPASPDVTSLAPRLARRRRRTDAG